MPLTMRKGGEVPVVLQHGCLQLVHEHEPNVAVVAGTGADHVGVRKASDLVIKVMIPTCIIRDMQGTLLLTVVLPRGCLIELRG
jgi:hypothetical protein